MEISSLISINLIQRLKTKRFETFRIYHNLLIGILIKIKIFLGIKYRNV